MKAIILLLVALTLTSCATRPSFVPHYKDDKCSIYAHRPDPIIDPMTLFVAIPTDEFTAMGTNVNPEISRSFCLYTRGGLEVEVVLLNGGETCKFIVGNSGNGHIYTFDKNAKLLDSSKFGYPQHTDKFIVQVQTNSTYSTRDVPIELSSLRRMLRNRYARSGKYPIVLDNKHGSTLSNAWPVVELAAGTGLWQQGIFVENEIIMFSVPGRDPGPPRSPVILKGFKGNSLPGGEWLRVSARALELKGRRINMDDLAKHLGRITNKDSSILVIATDDAAMSELGKILKAISDTGQTNISLSKEMKTVEQSPAGDRLKAPPEE